MTTVLTIPEERRTSSLISRVHDLLDAQPPPVSGDYSTDGEEDAAIEARSMVRDWYRLQLQQIVEGFKDD